MPSTSCNRQALLRLYRYILHIVVHRQDNQILKMRPVVFLHSQILHVFALEPLFDAHQVQWLIANQLI